MQALVHHENATADGVAGCRFRDSGLLGNMARQRLERRHLQGWRTRACPSIAFRPLESPCDGLDETALG